jgi:prevent-host-death family protein
MTKVYNIHEAKTHLSRLVEGAARGEDFVIAKSGRPMVNVTAVNPQPKRAPQRFGFLKGQIRVPDDIDTMFAADIEAMFYGDE